MFKCLKEPRNLTLRYSYVQSSFYMAYAVVMGFASVYLLDCGVSNTAIGIVMALGCSVSALVQPIVASYADRPSALSVKYLIMIISSLAMIVSGAMIMLHHRSVFLTSVFYVAAIAGLLIQVPIVNSLGMESLNQGRRLNWGLARGLGSLIYGIIAYIVGILVDDRGALTIPICMLIGFCLEVLSCAFYPFRKTVQQRSGVQNMTHCSALDFSRKYPKFTGVLIGAVCIYIGHSMVNAYAYQIVVSKGGGSTEMGITVALSAIVELPVMFLFDFMVKKVRCDLWMKVSAVFFLLRISASLLAPNILAYYGVQFIHSLGWPLISVASVFYVNALMEEEDRIKGQAFMTMTYAVACAIGCLMGGYLIDVCNVNVMMFAGCVFAVIGMGLMLIYMEKV